MPERGHLPQRKCTGCGTVRPRAELVRFVRSAGGGVAIAEGASLPGRGAYICAASAEACLAQAERRRHLARSLQADHGVIDYPELGAQVARLLDAKEKPPSPPP